MIAGFSEQTKPLSSYESETLLPLIVQGLHSKVGKDKAITNQQICTALKNRGCKLDNARLRKIINHIRINNLVIGLIATSDGYYIAEDKKELEVYVGSLRGRENAIRVVRQSLENQIALYE